MATDAFSSISKDTKTKYSSSKFVLFWIKFHSSRATLWNNIIIADPRKITRGERILRFVLSFHYCPDFPRALSSLSVRRRWWIFPVWQKGIFTPNRVFLLIFNFAKWVLKPEITFKFFSWQCCLRVWVFVVAVSGLLQQSEGKLKPSQSLCAPFKVHRSSHLLPCGGGREKIEEQFHSSLKRRPVFFHLLYVTPHILFLSAFNWLLRECFCVEVNRRRSQPSDE